MKDTHGRWNATWLTLVVPPPSSGGISPVNCSIHPKNQTFLQLNLSLYHYQYPNSIFVRILGLPYTVDTSSSLTPYTPPLPSTSPSTSHPSDSACLREKNITFQWYPEKVEVRFLQRETNDWYANISWTPLTGKQRLLMPVITITMMMMMMVMMQERFLRGFGRKSSFWDSTAHIYLINSWLKSAYVSNIFTNLFESAFKLMKNGVYFLTLGWRVIQDFDSCKLKDLRL
ncbi:PREDICTED: uncharacterized protein LOC107344978 [Acropora digitifera]|uniref:uncharacterized protein LOC107344978 n=1 Tax=Acropora digitifera TaxID=70779 RepID=UPI00077AD8DF|nr:PREDICTED: uncharacterized protein LOC107344978 [Acropora digitifera]